MSATAQLSGQIEPHILYDLSRFKAISGNGEAAIRRMRRAGLKVMYTGRKGYILGSDFIAWLANNSTSTKA